jgi:hypothetical protein
MVCSRLPAGARAPVDGHDLTALVDGQPEPDRLRNLALILGTINEPLAKPIPRSPPGFEVRRQDRLLLWLIPGLERGLAQTDMPDAVRAALLRFGPPSGRSWKANLRFCE